MLAGRAADELEGLQIRILRHEHDRRTAAIFHRASNRAAAGPVSDRNRHAGRKLHEIADLLGVPLPELPDFKGTSKLVGGNGKWELKAQPGWKA